MNLAQFALESQRAPRRARGTRRPSSTSGRESAVLAACLRICRVHPKVAWARRMNVGAYKVDDRFVRFGFAGLSDLIGQLRSGEFLAVETKAIAGSLTPAQRHFLEVVSTHGGLALCVRNPFELISALDRWPA